MKAPKRAGRKAEMADAREAGAGAQRREAKPAETATGD
jgi:hypothetical protein